MGENDNIRVEVAYALSEEQAILSLMVKKGTTVEQAIQLSGILERFPQIDLATSRKFGIFGKLTKADTVLKEGDRVEIYRPLIADPKEVRRKRAEEGKVMTKGAAARNTDEGDAG